MLNIEDISSVYFIGIGGIAMSATAGIAKEQGFTVSGSDGKNIYSPSKEVLDSKSISYHIGYDQKHAELAKADLYILSAGEDMTNPEVKYVIDANLPRASFAELLAAMFKDKLRVVVAGTHGKSTTSGLLGHLLKNQDNSSFIVGAVSQNYESNFYLGDGNYIVFEGDEYKSQFDDPTPKFQYYNPDILVLNNLEFDHPDLFENFEQLETEFSELIAKVPEDGLIIYNADDANLVKLVHQSNVSSVSFGIDEPSDFHAEHIDYNGGYTTIEVSNKFSKQVSSKLLGQTEQYKTQLPGKINVYNALAGIATLRALGFQQEQIALDLLTYSGVKRRFEVIGVKNGITIIDDYAHHPTAVKETLDAARLRYPEAKIWAVFEPHTFSRTKALLPDLAKCFNAADMVLISDIYAARESSKDMDISSDDVIEAVKIQNSKFSIYNAIRHAKDKATALSILKSEAKPGDVIIVMAVGSFNSLAYELKGSL